MLRSFVSQLLKGGSARPAAQPAAAAGREPGALAYVVNVDEPVRVDPGAELYSELASVRLRAFVPALHLAESRPVYLVPPELLATDTALDAVAPVETLVVTKFSTADLLAAPERFEALLAWLARARGRIRLVADLSDNYAAIGEATGQPFLGRYQAALGELCVLTVACEALRAELAPYAKRGIHVIEDPYESPQARPPRGPRGDPARLCWFGQLGTANLESVARGLARAAGGLRGRAAELLLVTHETRRELAAALAELLLRAHPSLATRFVPWSPEATWRAIDDCDLVILPQEHGERWGRVKSHNRLVEAIRGGRIAIASPIPSYLELADYAWVGDDLGAGVAWALDHPDEAVARIRAGQERVAARFSPERIAAEWERLLAGSGEPSDAAAAAGGEAVVRLNLGCGDKILPGYVNVDVAASRAGKSPDVLCDLHALTPFESDSADEVLAVHVVEHFWRWEVVDVLREWARVLKPGGRMILECPNLLAACEELLRNPVAGAGPGQEGQRTMWVFYGDPAWRDPLMCHRWNYTPQSLGAIMAEAGLVNVRQEPAQFKLREPRDMRLVGEKPRTRG
ncbi:MAG: methyltransferase domain-containing protein [Burkholderiales bacterium]|nr:methyltransferase domain-containing protein [Burkholderiales bacterium]